MASTDDLKIHWIWHLLINVLRILKPEISQLVWKTIQVIGPTLLRNKNAKNVILQC